MTSYLPTPPLLEFRNVAYRYPDGSVGLDGCSLGIRPGTRNALLGANGAGKTTLFQHANGLLKPLSGSVLYAGAELDYGRQCLRRLRADVGLVFQNPDRQLFSASVREDVSFGPFNLGLDAEIVRQRVEAALAAVKLSHCADKAVHNLSFGQKKRVCIAGVLAMSPSLLILDEPMAGLDNAMCEELLAVLDDLQANGMTLLLATHDIDFAYRWSDHIHVMAAGRCLASFAAAELPAHVETLAAAGLPPPGVIELCRRLVRRGVLPESANPRSLCELNALLES